MKRKTFDRAFNWFYKKVYNDIDWDKMLLGKDPFSIKNNFKENFKKKSIVETKYTLFSTFLSWSFENDDWKVVKQHEATKLVFRIHFKNNGDKRLIKRYFVKINWNEHL